MLSVCSQDKKAIFWSLLVPLTIREQRLPRVSMGLLFIIYYACELWIIWNIYKVQIAIKFWPRKLQLINLKRRLYNAMHHGAHSQPLANGGFEFMYIHVHSLTKVLGNFFLTCGAWLCDIGSFWNFVSVFANHHRNYIYITN